MVVLKPKKKNNLLTHALCRPVLPAFVRNEAYSSSVMASRGATDSYRLTTGRLLAWVRFFQINRFKNGIIMMKS